MGEYHPDSYGDRSLSLCGAAAGSFMLLCGCAFLFALAQKKEANKECRKAGKKIMALEHEALTERIIGAAIEVHRRLGPGYLESFYEKALIMELRKRGLSVRDQFEIIVRYDDVEIGCH